MDTIHLRKLLEKYYNGETDRMEERKLFHYFHSPEVSAEFQEDKELFLTLFQARDFSMDGISFQELLEMTIHKEENGRRILSSFLSSWKSTAAILIVIISISGFWFFKHTRMANRHPAIADTYSDPQLAMEETKKALLLVSSKLNKGTKPLNHLGKFNHGMQQLNTVSIILTPPKKY